MSMRRIGFSAMLALASGLLVAPPARASGIDAKERAARRACLSGNYKKGVEILSDLFVKTEDPVFIFNQGRCFEQNGRFEEAITRFLEYLRKAKKSNGQDRADTERHIADCQALLRQKATQEPKVEAPVAAKPVPEPVREEPKINVAPPPSPPAGPSADAQPPASRHGQNTTVTPEPPAPPAPREGVASGTTVQPEPTMTRTSNAGSGLRIAGVSALAVGVAGIAAGLVLNLKANSLADDIESQRPYQRSQEDKRASYETWSQIGYGVGGACLAAGAILYYIGYVQGRDAQVALAPTVQVGGFGASLQGAF